MTQMNLSVKWKQTHRHQELTCGHQEGGGSGGVRGQQKQTSTHRMIHTKVPLDSTENYIQYFEINHTGKEIFFKKTVYKYIYTYISESLLYSRN